MFHNQNIISKETTEKYSIESKDFISFNIIEILLKMNFLKYFRSFWKSIIRYYSKYFESYYSDCYSKLFQVISSYFKLFQVILLKD